MDTNSPSVDGRVRGERCGVGVLIICFLGIFFVCLVQFGFSFFQAGPLLSDHPRIYSSFHFG